MGVLRRVWRAIYTDLDLYALMLAGFTFTVLGVEGIADQKALSSVILAFLAVMAFSQVRSRRQARAVGSKSGVRDLFEVDFPSELYERRVSVASSYTFVGTSGYRTVSAGRRDFVAMVERGVNLRFLLLDPDLTDLVGLAAKRNSLTPDPDRLQQRIRSTITDLRELKSLAPDRVSIRLMSHLPAYGANVFDSKKPSGAVFVQLFEFLSSGEASPIFKVSGADGFWFEHFLAEIHRSWEASRDLP